MDKEIKKIKQLLNLPDPSLKEYLWELHRGNSVVQLLLVQNDDLSFKLTQKVKNTKIEKTIYSARPFATCVSKINNIIDNQTNNGFVIALKPELFTN